MCGTALDFEGNKVPGFSFIIDTKRRLKVVVRSWQIYDTIILDGDFWVEKKKKNGVLLDLFYRIFFFLNCMSLLVILIKEKK